ncbi:MAG: hypothetical protein DMF73_18430 [Acidobacteria bacterium]|nr:MAG: hypothetical protein DMF73_18430 [Acidobacteriota bacterium]
MIVRVMLTISKDNPCLFITAVAKNRLPVFRTEVIKSITVKAIDEARTSCGFLLFADVIMPDHFHVVTDSPRKPSTVLQFIKGIVSRRVLGYLKDMKYEESLRKLEHDNWKRNHRYSLWQHDSEVFSIMSEFNDRPVLKPHREMFDAEQIHSAEVLTRMSVWWKWRLLTSSQIRRSTNTHETFLRDDLV